VRSLIHAEKFVWWSLFFPNSEARYVKLMWFMEDWRHTADGKDEERRGE
jgi:hypothetical protein